MVPPAWRLRRRTRATTRAHRALAQAEEPIAAAGEGAKAKGLRQGSLHSRRPRRELTKFLLQLALRQPRRSPNQPFPSGSRRPLSAIRPANGKTAASVAELPSRMRAVDPPRAADPATVDKAAQADPGKLAVKARMEIERARAAASAVRVSAMQTGTIAGKASLGGVVRPGSSVRWITRTAR